jgi:cytochrome P450
MIDLFSNDARRNPYPLYEQLRAKSPLFQEPASGLWMVLDYDGVDRVLTDYSTFSSKYGPDWMIFFDPPRHTKLRALLARAFTPRSVANLEPRIAALVNDLLDAPMRRGEMDMAADLAIPLPMIVIAEMLGIPTSDRRRFKRWIDVMVEMSHAIGKTAQAANAQNAFVAATGEMAEYLGQLLRARRSNPADDLLTRMMQAEVDGERLSEQDILGIFQLLLLAGSETTTNLINNAILCFTDHPDQTAALRGDITLLPSAIEEVLRYRSPLQWMYRKTTHEVEIHGRVVPSNALVVAVIGAANRDPRRFADAGRFDIRRDPNPHLAFGHGNHFCLGAPLARLESRIALGELLKRTTAIERASDEPWEPREGLHVHGPTRLPVRLRR